MTLESETNYFEFDDEFELDELQNASDVLYEEFDALVDHHGLMRTEKRKKMTSFSDESHQ